MAGRGDGVEVMKKSLDEELMKVLDFLYSLDRRVDRDEIKKVINHKQSGKIIKILRNKEVLKPALSGDRDYSVNIDNLYDFRNNLMNNILQQEQCKIQKKQTWISKLMLIVTVVLICSTIYFSYTQKDISEGLFNLSQTQIEISQNQLALLEISTPPFDPKLRVWSERGEPLILIKDDLLNERNQTEIVEICFKNMGQTSTGHIYAFWDNNWSFNSNNIHIFDLESGKSRCEDLYLVADGCAGIKRDCNEDKENIVPFGETELRLRITCGSCEPNKEWNETFNAIIR